MCRISAPSLRGALDDFQPLQRFFQARVHLAETAAHLACHRIKTAHKNDLDDDLQHDEADGDKDQLRMKEWAGYQRHQHEHG